jgi:hypothetical protein
MLSVNDINVLGSLIDATFGRQSSHAGSIAIRTQLVGETLVITYHEVVNIAKDQDKLQQLEPVTERAQKEVKKCLKRIEDEFSRVAGKSLKTKPVSEGGSLEAMGYNFLSPVRPTLFRFSSTYSIG